MGSNKLLLFFIAGLLSFSSCTKKEDVVLVDDPIDQPVTPAPDPIPTEYFKSKVDLNDLSFHLKTAPNYFEGNGENVLYMGMSKDANTLERFEMEIQAVSAIDWWQLPKTFEFGEMHEDAFDVKYTTPSGKEFSFSDQCLEINNFKITITSIEGDVLEGEYNGSLTMDNCASVAFNNGAFKIKIQRR